MTDFCGRCEKGDTFFGTEGVEKFVHYLYVKAYPVCVVSTGFVQLCLLFL